MHGKAAVGGLNIHTRLTQQFNQGHQHAFPRADQFDFAARHGSGNRESAGFDAIRQYEMFGAM